MKSDSLLIYWQKKMLTAAALYI